MHRVGICLVVRDYVDSKPRCDYRRHVQGKYLLIGQSMVYYSFSTLTSTGYGDLVPVHPLVRSLSNLESVIGQLYPATLLARIVTLQLHGREKPK